MGQMSLFSLAEHQEATERGCAGGLRHVQHSGPGKTEILAPQGNEEHPPEIWWKTGEY